MSLTQQEHAREIVVVYRLSHYSFTYLRRSLLQYVLPGGILVDESVDSIDCWLERLGVVELGVGVDSALEGVELFELCEEVDGVFEAPPNLASRLLRIWESKQFKVPK